MDSTRRIARRSNPRSSPCGLASFLEARGVSVFEQSPVRTIAKGILTTDRGRIRAENVLRCTEGYTCRLPGLKRAIMPLHSMMIATEPLPDSVWKEIGLRTAGLPLPTAGAASPTDSAPPTIA